MKKSTLAIATLLTALSVAAITPVAFAEDTMPQEQQDSSATTNGSGCSGCSGCKSGESTDTTQGAGGNS